MIAMELELLIVELLVALVLPTVGMVQLTVWLLVSLMLRTEELLV